MIEVVLKAHLSHTQWELIVRGLRESLRLLPHIYIHVYGKEPHQLLSFLEIQPIHKIYMYTYVLGYHVSVDWDVGYAIIRLMSLVCRSKHI